MKTVLLLIGLIVTIAVQGQQLEIGVNTGLSNTNIRGLIAARNSITADVFLRRQHRHWFYQAGIQSIQFGSHLKDHSFLVFQEEGPHRFVKGTVKYNFSYLHLPLSIGYRMGQKRLKFITCTGVSPGLLLHHVVVHENHPDPTYRRATPSGVGRFNVNWLLGLGASYDLNETMGVQVMYTGQSGFTDLSNDIFFPGSSFRHIGSFFTIGLKYDISRKL